MKFDEYYHLFKEPKYYEGLVAICSYCDKASEDFNTCNNCRKKLPLKVKAKSITTIKRKDEHQANHQASAFNNTYVKMIFVIF